MPEPIYQEAQVDNDGNIILFHKRALTAKLKQLCPGKKVRIAIFVDPDTVLGKLKNYYHAVLVPEAKKALHNTGNRWVDRQVREYLEGNFLFNEELQQIEIDDESNTEKIMSDFIHRCCQHCAVDMDYAIPEPNSEYLLNNQKEPKNEATIRNIRD